MYNLTIQKEIVKAGTPVVRQRILTLLGEKKPLPKGRERRRKLRLSVDVQGVGSC